MKFIISCLWKAIVRTVDQDGVEHSGYMSFMMILAIFPFFVFLLSLTSFFGASEVGQQFIEFILDNTPNEAAESFAYRVKELSSAPPQSLMTLAIVGTIWTASSFVECLRTILNRVYDITSPPNYIFRRMLSIVQFLLLTVAIAIIMFIFVVAPVIIAKVPVLLEITNKIKAEYDLISGHNFDILKNILVFGSLFFTVSSLYYIIPNVKLSYKQVVPGALLCSILWILSGNLLSKYIKYYNQLSIVYGSLGSIIITLIFFYVINMLFIYGAEFNYLVRDKIIERSD